MTRVLLLVAVIGLLPLLVDLGQRLWQNEPYRFFPLAWVCGLLVWAARYGRTPSDPQQHPAGMLVFCVAAMILGALSLLRWSPWAGGLAVLALMGAASWNRAGWSAWRTLIPPLALIAISFPLPLGMDQVLMLELKKIAVVVSSSLLDLLGVVHMRSGTVIELPTAQLMVEDACSGIQSFMAVAAFAALLFVLERRPWWHWLLLSVFSCLVVVAANVLRITSGTYLLVTRGWDLLNGTPHLIFGAVIFVVELMLVFSFDRFLAFFEVGVRFSASGATAGIGNGNDAARSKVVPQPPESPVHGSRMGLALMAALAVFGLATGVRGTVYYANRPQKPAVDSYGPADFPEMAFTLPKELSGWSQGDSVPEERAIETIGLRSKVWVFTRGELQVFASIDYPFDHFHDLLNCYKTAGWASNEAGPVLALTPGRPSIAYLNLARRGFDRTEVWYTNCFSDGRWSGKAATEAGEARNASFWERVMRKTVESEVEGTGEIQFRVQVCWTGLAPLLESDRMAIRQLFESLSAELAGQVKIKTEKSK